MQKIKIINLDYHRNGVGGEGFHVATFNWNDADDRNKKHHMVGIVFDGVGQCAILDIDETQKDNVLFARGNSWRGDHFETELRQAIQQSYVPKILTTEVQWQG